MRPSRPNLQKSDLRTDRAWTRADFAVFVRRSWLTTQTCGPCGPCGPRGPTGITLRYVDRVSGIQWKTAWQREEPVAAARRTHAGLHQAVIGPSRLCRSERLLYEGVQWYASGESEGRAPPTAPSSPGLAVSTLNRHPRLKIGRPEGTGRIRAEHPEGGPAAAGTHR